MMNKHIFRSKKMMLILIAALFIIGFLLVLPHNKYWPTAHVSQLTQQLNADINNQANDSLSKLSIDKVKVYKSKRYLELLQGDQVIKRYPIRLGFNASGRKQFEGDGKTPEGIYTLDWRNPNSQFYRSLHVSYPNMQDAQYAASKGLSAGSNIMIHGSFPTRGKLLENGKPFYHYMPQKDWTLGCIAVSNAAMDDIWARTKNGTLIEIVP